MKLEIKNILKSWESSLSRFGKLDCWNLSENLSIIGSYLRNNNEEDGKTRTSVKYIRDIVISGNYNSERLLKTIHKTLDLAKNSDDDKTVNPYVKKKDNRILLEGQQVRFKAETQKIFKERLKFKKGMMLRNFDIETESAADTKMVRRIVEKRMSQAYHKMNRHEEGYKTTIHEKYWMRRATAFQLYNIGQKENVKNVTRGMSTHWKRQLDPFTNEVVFKKKMPYRNEEAALRAVEEWTHNHPEEKREMAAYKCSDCGKWHIGHKVSPLTHPILGTIIPQLKECC